MLCLGADVELSISRGTARRIEADSINGSTRQLASNVEYMDVSLPEDVAGDGLELREAFAVLDQDDYIGGSLIAEGEVIDSSISQKNSVANSKKAPIHVNVHKELLLVTLVHGDMLALEGDDFTVSLIRVHNILCHLNCHPVYFKADRDEHWCVII